MKDKVVLAGLVGAGIVVFLLGANSARRNTVKQDVQIDPALGKHRGLAPQYGGRDSTATRAPSAQDPKGGAADYLGYNYSKTVPGSYAKGEPAQHAGRWYDKREDAWAFIEPNPIDYQKPPVRIPKLWKDATRYWDSAMTHGGTEVVAQRFHLFHLRPSAPTRGYRSVSGVFATTGGGQSTASRARIPAIFIPSAIA